MGKGMAINRETIILGSFNLRRVAEEKNTENPRVPSSTLGLGTKKNKALADIPLTPFSFVANL
jgi:hypothetical protein